MEYQIDQGPPASSNYSYAIAKRAMMAQIHAYNKQYNTNYCFVIPCNIYGNNDKYDERSHFMGALIRKIHEAKESCAESITLFGTGKPLRQYIHAKDVADILVFMVDNNKFHSFNIAPDENLSIDQIAKTALKACNAQHLKIIYNEEKPDGQYRKDCSNQWLKNYYPKVKFTSLKEGIKEVYHYFKQLDIVNDLKRDREKKMLLGK